MFKFTIRSMQPYMDGETDTGAGSTTETQVETQQTETEQTEQTTTQTEQTEQTEQPRIKVKFNKEEKEIPYEEAVQLAQKGMNYEKAIERARQEATDQWIANQGYEWNGKPITTEADYKQALAEQAEYQRKAELEQQGIDPSIVDQYINNNPTVKQAKELLKQQEEQQKQQKEYAEFFDYFRSENGRDFNSTSDEIPQEVWEMTKKGKSLTDAYTYHANKQLKAKIAEYEAKLKAQETNEKNASSSPGSVTGNGEVKGDYVSFDTFEANKNDRDWVMKNYNKIVASRPKW